ncbi:serine protease [Salipiger sp. P9]|nr:serine protease [Salipiger pentaromativorans]
MLDAIHHDWGAESGMAELTLAERLTLTTTRISAFQDGAQVGFGTGFFFNFKISDQQIIPAIITNKHVVNGCDQITVVCHTAKGSEPSGEFIPCHLDARPGAILAHPDPDIDLCAIPFGPILNQAEANGTPLFYTGLGFDIVPQDDDWQYFDALEEVIMIGCPRGIFDEFNNLPITRRGNTASSLSKLYGGKQEFMVDMACFPGSSGSPIFVYDRNGYLDRKTNNYHIGASRIQFVGVLYSGPLIASDGKIVLQQNPKIEVSSMMHLGNAIRSSQLHGIEKQVLARFSAVAPKSEDVGEVSFDT